MTKMYFTINKDRERGYIPKVLMDRLKSSKIDIYVDSLMKKIHVKPTSGDKDSKKVSYNQVYIKQIIEELDLEPGRYKVYTKKEGFTVDFTRKLS